MSQTPLAPTRSSVASESESDTETTEESPLTTSPTRSGGSADPATSKRRQAVPASDGGAAGYVADFLALPSQVFIIFFLEFLNSYRNFGLRFVQYQYISNEFGMTDVETGSLLGVKSTVRTRSLARSLTPALAGSHSLARRALGATHERFNGRWLGLRADGHHLRHHRQPADGRDRRPQDGDDGAGDGIGWTDVLRARAQLHRAVDHLTYLLALWRGGAWHGCVRPLYPLPLPPSPLLPSALTRSRTDVVRV
jgi:hypothetical protein